MVSCSDDRTAKVWDALQWHCLYTIDNYNEPVSAAAWLPDGGAFVTGSMDKEGSLNMWSSRPDKPEILHTWSESYRVTGLAVSPDGSRLITTSGDLTSNPSGDPPQIHVYNLHTKMKQYSMGLKAALTCVTISKDSCSMLVNMTDGELQQIDINNGEVLQRYHGQRQGTFIIRSTFGGVDESLVISGSEGTDPFHVLVCG